MLTLVQRVHSFIRCHGLMASGQRIVVAVSGGADSLCLLLLLLELRAELEVSLHIAHLDHGLRGAASAADARFVEALARRLDVPATVERRDALRFRTEHRLSLEEAARQVRYDFLADVVEATGAASVAVAHTANDQVETILLHLIRGTMLAGLRGMRPQHLLRLPPRRRPLVVVRPLLTVSRAETEACCQTRGFEARFDPTNVELGPLRNRIRAELLPLLERYNPKFRAALLRLASLAGEDLELLERQVAEVWRGLATVEPGRVRLARAPLLAEPRAMRRHIVRRAVQELAGDLVDLVARHVAGLVDLLDRPVGARMDLPRGLTFHVEYDAYVLALAGEVAPPPLPPLPAEEVRLAVPGTARFGWWTITAQLELGPAGRQDYRPPGRNAWLAELDFDRTGPTLWVRSRRPGDRFWPLGLVGPKKLQDFLVDAKVPRAWRDRVPVVVSPMGIVWLAGWRIDERVKVTPATTRILRLEFRRDADDQPAD